MVRLYGVQHGGYVNDLGILSMPLEVYPSAELLRDLRSLPAGSIVGIEYFEEMCHDGRHITPSTVKVGGRKIPSAKSYVHYWQRILNALNDNTRVVFLDDLETFNESIAMAIKAEKKSKKLDMLFLSGEKTQCHQVLSQYFLDKVKQLRQAAYSDSVESAYRYEEGREEKMLERMARYKPDVAIVGSAHGDMIIHDRQVIEGEHDIKFDGYAKEEDPMAGIIPIEEHHFHRTTVLDRNPHIDERTVAERNSIRRKLSAVKLGRILIKDVPDFIGSWDEEIPAQGLFEMYIAPGHKFEGVIEDTLGTAAFMGELTGNKVRFAKAYDEMAVMLGGVDRPIVYEGELKDGKYRGFYRVPGSSSRPRAFELEKFDGVLVKE